MESDSDYIRVERVRGHSGEFEEQIKSEYISPPIRTADELAAIEDTVTSLSHGERAKVTFGQAFGPVDELDEFTGSKTPETVVDGKTVEVIVDEVRTDAPSRDNKIRDEWDTELLLLRGTTSDSDWELRSATGTGGREAPWHVYTYPYNPETGECQPANAITSGWILDIERAN
jgi:hypothetical protein